MSANNPTFSMGGDIKTLPTGKTTKNADEYIRQWKALAQPLAELFKEELFGFDKPGIGLFNPKYKTVSDLDLKYAKLIYILYYSLPVEKRKKLISQLEKEREWDTPSKKESNRETFKK